MKKKILCPLKLKVLRGIFDVTSIGLTTEEIIRRGLKINDESGIWIQMKSLLIVIMIKCYEKNN